MNSMLGMDVITSAYLTETELVQVARSARERWWSWPWRPWATTKTVQVQIPSSQMFQLPGGKLLCHPAMLDRIRELREDQP